jgi:ferredoxin
MAIVFWKPSEKGDLMSTIDGIFEDILDQDQQTKKLSISPFFKAEQKHKKIVFFTDISRNVQNISNTLNTLDLLHEKFTQALEPISVHSFFSLRHSSSLPTIKEFFPQAENSLSCKYALVSPPPVVLPKASFSQSLPLGFGPTMSGPSISPSITSLPQAKNIYWPEALVEADIIIPINLFETSSLFTIHGTISSLFYALPQSCQSFILVQSNLRNRSHMLLEHLQPLIPKIHHSVLFDSKDEPYISISNDFVSADSFSSALAGIRALQIPLNRLAHQRHWGNGDIVKITLIGPSFRKPLKYLGKEISFDFKSHLVSLSEKCIQCNQCVLTCPFSAWEKTTSTGYAWNSSKCHYCGHCIDICPSSAVQIISKGVAHGKNFSH